MSSSPPPSFPFHIKHHIIDAAHIREYPRATANSQDEALKLHVNEYVPKDNPNPQKGDVTIVGGHANGFPKELYEPLWQDLHREAKALNVPIRSIIIVDAAWQGQSGLLNKAVLGNDPGWLDYARDMIQVLNTLRPPTPLMAVGHSFGANALANAALLHPRLLSALVLLDPVVSRYASTPESRIAGPAAASISRRESWPSRQAAATAFARSRFYQSWDPRVLDRWVTYGLSPSKESGEEKSGEGSGEREVVLTTPKHQELFTFLRPSWPAYSPSGTSLLHPSLVPDLDPSLNQTHPTYPLYRPEGATTLDRLPNLRPAVLYVFGGLSDISPKDLQDEKMRLTGSGLGGSGGQQAGRVKKVVGDRYGHLIPMEDPGFCARAAADWIKIELDLWWAAQREYDEWTKKPLVEKNTISDEWYTHLGKSKDKIKAKAKI